MNLKKATFFLEPSKVFLLSGVRSSVASRPGKIRQMTYRLISHNSRVAKNIFVMGLAAIEKYFPCCSHRGNRLWKYPVLNLFENVQ